MLAADSRSSHRRYAAPAIAMAAAAAVAVAPVATSMGAVTAPSLPPIVQDLGGAASAVANWATAMGLKFVTDPVTGLTKLVTDQIGNATVIGNVLLTGGRDVLKGIVDGLPEAIAEAQKLLAAGQPGAAWQEIANTFIGPVLGGLLNGMTPILNQLGPQIGPFADAFQAAMIPIIGLVFPALTSIVTPPSLVLDGLQAAAKALQAGDPFGAVNSLLGTAGKLGEFAVEAVFGEIGVANGLVGLIPAILSGLAGSDWASAGPFTLPTGNKVTFAAASASTLAASPTALPAFPDLGQIAKTWAETLAGLGESYLGENGIPRVIKAYVDSIPKGEWVQSYQLAHGILFSPVLGLGMTLTETVAKFTPFLGPLGKALDGTAPPLVSLAIGAYVNSMQIGVDLSTAAENVTKALGSGDPVKALTAMITGTGAALSSTLNTLFSTDAVMPGLLPALVGVAQGAIDGLTGKAAETGDVTTLADAPAKTAAADAVDDAGSAPSTGGATQPSSPAVTDEDAPAAGAPTTEAPAESPVEEAPVETPAAETPVETPAETPVTESPAEEAPAAEASDESAASDGTDVTDTQESAGADTAEAAPAAA